MAAARSTSAPLGTHPIVEKLYGPVLAVGLLVQLAGLWLADPVVALVGFAIGALADVVTWDEQGEVRGRLRRVGLGLLQRVTIRALILGIVLGAEGASSLVLLLYVGGVLALAAAARGEVYLLGRVIAEEPATGARNLGEDLDLYGFFDRLRRRRTVGYSTICSVEIVLAAGLALAAFVGDTVGAVLLAVAIVALVGVLAAVLRWAFAFLRSDRIDRYVLDLEQAIADTGAEVLVYFSGGRAATYQLEQWMPVLERLDRPTLFLLREAHHLGALPETRWPVVVARRHRDVETALAADPEVVLYVAQAGRNIHFLRYGRPKHVFLNHGDSDKVSSVNPVVKVYDKLFVAGRVGIDRYRQAGVGLPDDRFAVVGRPQLDRVLDERRRTGEGPTTVLYAPTWEGFFDAADYSSLERSGERLVRQLLRDRPELRIVFKPHPASGSVRPEAGAAKRRVETLLRDAGGPHVVASDHPDLDLLDWFDRSDVLIADISAVVTDFLHTDKPYLVTNPRGLDPVGFAETFPSHTAAYVVSDDLADLETRLAAALGPDPMADARAEMKRAVLGEHPDGPYSSFVRALDQVVAEARADAGRIANTFEHRRA